MPRKAAAAAGTATDAGEPRRSSRIKDQPKPEPVVKKAPAKPRAKKVDKEDKADKDEKPKSRGRKRKDAPGEPNGAEEDGDKPPPAKKVCLFISILPSSVAGIVVVDPDSSFLD
jgi:hypothetical protein